MLTKTYDLFDGNGTLLSSQSLPFTAADYDARIVELENSITPRRLREAVLTESGKAWLAAQENEIAAVRAMKEAL